MKMDTILQDPVPAHLLEVLLHADLPDGTLFSVDLGTRLFTPRNYDTLDQSDPSSEDMVPQFQNNINQDD